MLASVSCWLPVRDRARRLLYPPLPRLLPGRQLSVIRTTRIPVHNKFLRFPVHRHQHCIRWPQLCRSHPLMTLPMHPLDHPRNLLPSLLTVLPLTVHLTEEPMYTVVLPMLPALVRWCPCRHLRSPLQEARRLLCLKVLHAKLRIKWAAGMTRHPSYPNPALS